MQANRSSGGSHSGQALKRTGYCGLGTAVRNLALHTEETLDIDVVVCIFHMLSRHQLSILTCDKAASIGNLNDSFIKSIYLAAQGNPPCHMQPILCSKRSPHASLPIQA